MAASSPLRLATIDTATGTLTPQERGEDNDVPSFAALTLHGTSRKMRMEQRSRAK